MDNKKFIQEKKPKKVFLGLTLNPQNVEVVKKVAKKHNLNVSQTMDIILDDFRLGYLKKQLEKKE